MEVLANRTDNKNTPNSQRNIHTHKYKQILTKIAHTHTHTQPHTLKHRHTV